MTKSLGDLLKKSALFFIKSIDQGIYGHLQIDSEFLINKYYFKIVNLAKYGKNKIFDSN